MEKIPRITIVTPSFNQGNFIRETIESIINQNYPNLEYFILDGGSTDNSVDIIREYEDRIDWWVSEKDDGQTDAINKGFKKASGELLCWVNSDDILLPGCLQEIAKYYSKKNKPDLIHANWVYINQDGIVTRLIRVPRQTRFFMYRGVWSIPQPAAFYKASLLKKIDYLDPQYQVGMDLDIWMRTMKAGARVAHLTKYLGAFRWHQNSKNSFLVRNQKHYYEEHPEATKIFNTELAISSKINRQMWRIIWQIYRVTNLNYLRSSIDTLQVQGQHWMEIVDQEYKHR